MKMRYVLALAAVLLMGAGCTATTDSQPKPDDGVRVDGTIRADGSGSGY